VIETKFHCPTSSAIWCCITFLLELITRQSSSYEIMAHAALSGAVNSSANTRLPRRAHIISSIKAKSGVRAVDETMNDLLTWYNKDEEKSIGLAEELFTRIGESLQEFQHPTGRHTISHQGVIIRTRPCNGKYTRCCTHSSLATTGGYQQRPTIDYPGSSRSHYRATGNVSACFQKRIDWQTPVLAEDTNPVWLRASSPLPP
jgi:hypothetical protein